MVTATLNYLFDQLFKITCTLINFSSRLFLPETEGEVHGDNQIQQVYCEFNGNFVSRTTRGERKGGVDEQTL